MINLTEIQKEKEGGDNEVSLLRMEKELHRYKEESMAMNIQVELKDEVIKRLIYDNRRAKIIFYCMSVSLLTIFLIFGRILDV